MFPLLVLLCCSLLPPQPKIIYKALEPFNSHWRGEFKVYSFDGELLDRLEVEQRYSWEGDEQIGSFIERHRDGKVVHARARSYERNGRLLCEVKKDNDEHTLHIGRFEDGVLFWFRQSMDAKTTETFKERVVKTPKGREYQIDGLGVYKHEKNTSILLFEGRYQEVK